MEKIISYLLSMTGVRPKDKAKRLVLLITDGKYSCGPIHRAFTDLSREAEVFALMLGIEPPDMRDMEKIVSKPIAEHLFAVDGKYKDFIKLVSVLKVLDVKHKCTAMTNV